MAKSKKQDEQFPSQANPDPNSDPVPKSELPYEVGQWKGREKLSCKECAWDTLRGAEVMLQHINETHRVRSPRVVIVPAYSAWGRPIEINQAEKSEKAGEKSSDVTEDSAPGSRPGTVEEA